MTTAEEIKAVQKAILYEMAHRNDKEMIEDMKKYILSLCEIS